jgi:polyribonucleotide nucleotidyltransferase
MAAGVPITAPIAGISVGLITGETDDDYKIITDIQGLEDHLGDMDFKVAGSHDGITAIQLDMKVEGITMEMVEKSIWQTRDARFIILDEVMLKAIAEPRAELGETVPKISIIHINPEKIGEVIGPKGKTIDKIIEETGVKIDIEDDGKVYVCGVEQAMVQKAIEIIESIGKDLEIGATYTGKIVKIMNFGAFVEIAPGKEGLIHISKLAHERVEKVEDLFSEGDVVSAKLMEIDDKGRINLSRKAILPKPEKKVEAKPQTKNPEVKVNVKEPKVEVKNEGKDVKVNVQEPKVEVKVEEKSKKKITDIFFKK